jgi:hypothetical protein
MALNRCRLGHRYFTVPRAIPNFLIEHRVIMVPLSSDCATAGFHTAPRVPDAQSPAGGDGGVAINEAVAVAEVHGRVEILYSFGRPNSTAAT